MGENQQIDNSLDVLDKKLYFHLQLLPYNIERSRTKKNSLFKGLFDAKLYI